MDELSIEILKEQERVRDFLIKVISKWKFHDLTRKPSGDKDFKRLNRLQANERVANA